MARRTLRSAWQLRVRGVLVRRGGPLQLRYRPALAPISYRVTNLHLGNGRVRPVYGPTKAAKVVENMTATRVHQATSPDQGVLYTLYTNQPPEFLSGASNVDPEHALAFIHTLDLWNGTAVCIGTGVVREGIARGVRLRRIASRQHCVCDRCSRRDHRRDDRRAVQDLRASHRPVVSRLGRGPSPHG